MPCEPAAAISPIESTTIATISSSVAVRPPPDRIAITTMPSPRMLPSQPTTNSPGAARPSIVNVPVPGRPGTPGGAPGPSAVSGGSETDGVSGGAIVDGSRDTGHP
jgi:hypothetical protein